MKMRKIRSRSEAAMKSFYVQCCREFGERVWPSADGVEKLGFVGVGGEGFPHDFAGQDAALTALAGHAEAIAYFANRVGTIFHRCADLGVGDSLAKAYVHRVMACSYNKMSLS